MNLTDTIQHWLQGQINAAIDGVLARLSRLEALNVDDQITGLRMENDRLLRRINNGDQNINNLNTQLHRVSVDNTQNIDNLHTEVRTLAKLVADLEDQNKALREELAYVKNNVKTLVQDDPCDSEAFSDRVRDIIAEYMANEDSLVTTRDFDEMVEAFINESVFKIKVR